MIASVKGTVEIKDFPHIVVDVNGVGYKILISNALFSKLEIGEKTKLFTFTYVREEALDLYGFPSLEELKLFESLISVSGVGPKTAISVFSIGSKDEITQAIIKADVSFFTNVPRLGKKNAQKIIIELKNKLGSLEDLDLSESVLAENKDVIVVLKNLGFTTRETAEAIRNFKGNNISIEEKVRLALKNLGK